MPWAGRGMVVDVVPEQTCSLGEPVFFLMGQEITKNAWPSILLIHLEQFIRFFLPTQRELARGFNSCFLGCFPIYPVRFLFP